MFTLWRHSRHSQRSGPRAPLPLKVLQLAGASSYSRMIMISQWYSRAPDGASRSFRCPIGPPAESGVAGGDDGLAAFG